MRSGVPTVASMHSQRVDHPILISIPEANHLKGFTVEVIATR